MTPEDQLAAEARLRRGQALVAGAAALLLVLTAVVQSVGPQPKVTELTVQLIVINQRFPLDVIGAVLQALGVLGLVATLVFLFAAARARRPEMSPATRGVVLAGGVVFGIVAVITSVLLAIKAHQFVTQGSQTYQQANHLTKGSALPILQVLEFAAQFALDIGLILIALNAMRVGLLTRFMGYCGMVVGAAGMLLLGSAPAIVIEVFWLGALAYLFAGRWPGGDPPAWRSGKAEPWPSARELREERVKAAGGAAPRRPKPAPEPAAVGAPAAATRTRAGTPKRKRKRRR